MDKYSQAEEVYEDIPEETAEALFGFREQMLQFGVDSPEAAAWFAQHQEVPYFRELADESQRLERLFSPPAAPVPARDDVPDFLPQPSVVVEAAPVSQTASSKGAGRWAVCGVAMLGLGVLGALVVLNTRRDSSLGLGMSSSGGAFSSPSEGSWEKIAGYRGEGGPPPRFSASDVEWKRLRKQARLSREANKVLLQTWDSLKETPGAWNDPKIQAICRNVEVSLVNLYREDSKSFLDLVRYEENATLRKVPIDFITVVGSQANAEDKQLFLLGLREIATDNTISPGLREQAETALRNRQW